MNKVYILAQHLQLGGGEKAVINLANALCEQEVDVTLLVVIKSKPIIPVLSNVKIHFLTNMTINIKEKKFERYVRKCKELKAVKFAIQQIRNATVISSRNEYTTLLSKYGDKSIKKIGQLHNKYTRLMKYDFIHRYKNINYFVQLTDEIRDEIQNIISVKNNFTKVITITNFIDFKKKPVVSKENIIIAVGGFNPVKGFDRLIEIWSLLANKYSQWKLIIIGDGMEMENIKSLVHSKKLNDNVIFPGTMENNQVFEMMAKSKIYAMTSYSEAFPFVLLEAMQSLLCVISFDVWSGPRAIIKEGYNGVLVEDNNIELYAKKLEELILNEKIREEMAENAYKESLNYVKENVIGLWLKII